MAVKYSKYFKKNQLSLVARVKVTAPTSLNYFYDKVPRSGYLKLQTKSSHLDSKERKKNKMLKFSIVRSSELTISELVVQAI